MLFFGEDSYRLQRYLLQLNEVVVSFCQFAVMDSNDPMDKQGLQAQHSSCLSLDEYVAIAACVIASAIYYTVKNTRFANTDETNDSTHAIHRHTPISHFRHFHPCRYATPTTSKSSPKFPASATEQLDEDKLESEREMIAFNTQQLIDDINNKRKRDTSLLQGESYAYFHND